MGYFFIIMIKLAASTQADLVYDELMKNLKCSLSEEHIKEISDIIKLVYPDTEVYVEPVLEMYDSYTGKNVNSESENDLKCTILSFIQSDSTILNEYNRLVKDYKDSIKEAYYGTDKSSDSVVLNEAKLDKAICKYISTKKFASDLFPYVIKEVNKLVRDTLNVFYYRVKNITITNENNLSLDLSGIWIKLIVRGDLTIKKFLINRDTYTEGEFLYRYMHSHVQEISFDFNSSTINWGIPCLGTGNFADLMAELNAECTIENYMSLILWIEEYLKVESLKGIPYKPISNVVSGNTKLIKQNREYLLGTDINSFDPIKYIPTVVGNVYSPVNPAFVYYLYEKANWIFNENNETIGFNLPILNVWGIVTTMYKMYIEEFYPEYKNNEEYNNHTICQYYIDDHLDIHRIIRVNECTVDRKYYIKVGTRKIEVNIVKNVEYQRYKESLIDLNTFKAFIKYIRSI